MAKLNITQAARQWNIARSTLQRAIKRGEVSVTAENGVKTIDSSEMVRVYGAAGSVSTGGLGGVRDSRDTEIELLREQIRILNKSLERQDQFIEEKERVIESQRQYIGAFFKRLKPPSGRSGAE